LVQSHFGSWGIQSYRLVYNLFAIITLFPVLWLAAWLPDRILYRITAPWLWLTLALQGLAILGFWLGIRQKSSSTIQGIKEFALTGEKESGELVKTGLYRWVRHPLYLAGLVFIWMAPIMTRNLFFLNIGLTVYIIIGAILEERKLIVEYGETYQEYQRSTPMLIPGWKLLTNYRNEKDINRRT
jgi:protein-S-isoprenylcysteine O-methyltransferase Ste14